MGGRHLVLLKGAICAEESILKYKMYRNKLNTTIKLAKQNYYRNQLEHEKGNMRNTWKILNSCLRCSKKSRSRKFSNTDPKQINQCFANVVPAQASSIKHSGNDFNYYLQNSNSLTCLFVCLFVFETDK